MPDVAESEAVRDVPTSQAAEEEVWQVTFSALHPGGIVLSDTQQAVPKNLEYVYLRVPTCTALVKSCCVATSQVVCLLVSKECSGWYSWGGCVQLSLIHI